jgi:hypothetical protein
MNYTEQERAAYLAGDYKTADAYDRLERLETAIYRLMHAVGNTDDQDTLEALDNLREVLK